MQFENPVPIPLRDKYKGPKNRGKGKPASDGLSSTPGVGKKSRKRPSLCKGGFRRGTDRSRRG